MSTTVHTDGTTNPDVGTRGTGAAGAGDVIVGWTMAPDAGMGGHFGNRHPTPLTRPLTAPERALAHYLELASHAPTPDECRTHLDHALAIARTHDVVLTPPPPPPPGGGVSGHLARMDAARIAITAALVLGVLAIVCWALHDNDANAAAQFAAPVSGLAGICLGWLFTQQRDHRGSGGD